MKKQQLTIEIKKLSMSENISFVEACQAFQSAAAQKGDEKLITVIQKIKMASL